MRRAIGIACGVTMAFAEGPAHAATPHLDYFGGPVISNVQVYEVYWGPNIDATIKGQIDAFWKTIVDSPYIDWLGEYDTVGQVSKSDGDAGTNQRIRRGSYAGAITITPGNTATTLTFADVRAELQAQIAAKVLPAPTTDGTGNVNTYFAVEFPKAITLSDAAIGNSCVTWCSYFDDISVGGAHVAVSYDPYVNSDGACGLGCMTTSKQYFDAVTRLHSNDLLNVITGPRTIEVFGGGNTTLTRPAGWYSNTGDQGTIDENSTCSSTIGALGAYTVQFGWSNRLAKCVDQDPNLPLCDGTQHPCRPCSPTSLDGGAPDCTGATPDCDTTPGDTNQGLCVAAAPADAGVDSGADAAGGNDAGQGADAGTGGGGGGCSCDASPDVGTFATPLLAFGALVAARIRRRRQP